jgi:condensin complex subunit 3
MVDYLGTFFRSYAASHPKRQAQLCEGGLVAFGVVLERNTAMALKLLEVVARLTDAYTLTLIRDIDPQAAKRATREATEEVLGGEEDATRRSSRANATRSSMQSGRLLRELSRYSLHERLSEGLLMELAHSDLAESRVVCMEGLEKCMYFYSREPQPFLLHCINEARAALRAHNASALHDRLAAWQAELLQRYPTMSPAELPQPLPDNAEAEEMRRQWEGAAQVRTERLDAMLEAGFGGFAAIPPQLSATPAATGVKAEAAEVKRERDSDYFDVESIVGARKRTKF